MQNRCFFYSFITLMLFLINTTSLTAREQVSKGELDKNSKVVCHKKNTTRGKKVFPLIEKIRADMSSDERNRLRELQQSDPKAFQQEIAKIVKKYRENNSKKDHVLKELLKAYSSALDEDKPALKQQIVDAVRGNFNQKMAASRKNYEKAARRLQELKKKLDEREEQAESIIEARVKQLIKKYAKNR